MYPGANIQRKQLNPNLVFVGKLYLMCHDTYHEGAFLARLL